MAQKYIAKLYPAVMQSDAMEPVLGTRLVQRKLLRRFDAWQSNSRVSAAGVGDDCEPRIEYRRRASRSRAVCVEEPSA